MNAKIQLATIPAIEVYDALALSLGGAVKTAQLISGSMTGNGNRAAAAEFDRGVVLPLMGALRLINRESRL